jgi:hypothetical protein
VEVASNTEERLTTKIDSFPWFSIAMDESIYVSDARKLSNFFRGIDMEFSVTDVLAAFMPVKGPP